MEELYRLIAYIPFLFLILLDIINNKKEEEIKGIYQHPCDKHRTNMSELMLK